MRRLLLALACLTIAMACSAAPAAAQAPSGDSVTGTAQEFVLPTVLVTWTFDASSGPQGENPTGTVQNNLLGTGSVTCLSVQGNRAVIGVTWPGPTSFLIYVVDNGDMANPPDIIGYFAIIGPPTTVCPAPGGHEDRTIVGGDIRVVDAQPPAPTSKDQCKNGGWLNFPQFKNQGQCVAFVNHGGP